MSFASAFKSARKLSNPKSDRLCSLWARGNNLSSGSTVDGKTYVLTPASEDGTQWELREGKDIDLPPEACKKVVGTFAAPTKDKVETTFNGELFQTFILRGTIKVDGKNKEATAFMSSAKEINARAAAKGTDPGKYPIAYILYQDSLKKKED